MNTLNALARALVGARRDRSLLPAADWAQALATPEEAYAVLDEVAAAMGWFGARPPQHWKSGGPSREGVLSHGALPPAGVHASPADLSAQPFVLRGVEAEIALRLGEDVTPQRALTLVPETADALVDAMTVSIEIVDSRWREGLQAPALLRLADIQSHAALVLGPWVPYRRLDWAAQSCEVRIGARPPLVRTGTHSLGDPAWLLAGWLRHATRQGTTLPAGTVVTTGTWVGMLPAQAGDAVEVRFEGVGAAQVRL